MNLILKYWAEIATLAVTAGVCAFVVLSAGCRSGEAFVEGTRLRVGVYVPWDGQLYGLQMIEYLNGTALVAPTNSSLEVQRQYSGTNDYLGVVHTRDCTSTSATVTTK